MNCGSSDGSKLVYTDDAMPSSLEAIVSEFLRLRGMIDRRAAAAGQVGVGDVDLVAALLLLADRVSGDRPPTDKVTP